MKILFICPDWLGFATPIFDELQRQGHEVTYLNSREIGYFKYWSKSQHALNAVSRIFSKQSLRSRHVKWSTKRFLDGFCIGRNFDLTIFTDLNDIDDEHFAIVRQFSKRMVAIMWDSVGRRPSYLKRAETFDTIFAFDPEDVRQHGYKPITNYIGPSIEAFPLERKISGDLFTIFSFDNYRYHFLQRLLDANPTLKHRSIVVFEREKHARKAKDQRIENHQKPILGEALYPLISNYHAALDIGHKDQTGLSFRIFECLGHQQKLITTNHAIKETPLYSPENVYCLDMENPVIDPEFFKIPYKKMPPELVEYYQLKNWVHRVLDTK
jgi:hypothetical protein